MHSPAPLCPLRSNDKSGETGEIGDSDNSGDSDESGDSGEYDDSCNSGESDDVTKSRTKSESQAAFKMFRRLLS